MRMLSAMFAGLALVSFCARGQSTNVAGQNVTLRVTATGTNPFYYEWVFNGTTLSKIGAAEAENITTKRWWLQGKSPK